MFPPEIVQQLLAMGGELESTSTQPAIGTSTNQTVDEPSTSAAGQSTNGTGESQVRVRLRLRKKFGACATRGCSRVKPIPRSEHDVLRRTFSVVIIYLLWN